MNSTPPDLKMDIARDIHAVCKSVYLTCDILTHSLNRGAQGVSHKYSAKCLFLCIKELEYALSPGMVV